MLRTCPVCEIEFESDNLSKKYCSNECRLVVVRERDRIRKREERAKKRAEQEREKQRIKLVKQQEKEKAEQEAKQERERKRKELERKAKQGDTRAIMQLYSNITTEYWEAYQMQELKQAELYSKGKSKRVVNGISIHDPAFPEKIVMTIEELGHINSSLSGYEQ